MSQLAAEVREQTIVTRVVVIVVVRISYAERSWSVSLLVSSITAFPVPTQIVDKKLPYFPKNKG